MQKEDTISSKGERRYDIDWIRVIVFDILILYHVCMFFVDWNWHIKNNDIVTWIEWPMKFINQWRIPILFVVSGMGTRFAMSHRSGQEYVKERFYRLLLPLLVGILLIVPPQVYLERISQGIDYSNYINFYPDFFNGIYPSGNLSWHHLWFLPYLLTMSILATPLFIYLRKKENPFIQKLNVLFEKQPLYLLFPMVILLIPEYALGHFTITHAFIDDWYAWGLYSLLFVMGYILICSKDAFWKALDKMRFISLIIGMISFSLLVLFADGKHFNNSIYVWIPFVKVLNMWSWIIAIFAWSSKYLNKPSKVVRYRNKAVYPFYILHQTIIVMIGYYLMNLQIHYSIKMLILVFFTFSICWLIYELLILKLTFIQPLFGVKNKQKK